jgi:hypothetical protein
VGVALLCALLSLGGLSGCVTTTYPDGTVVESLDLDAMVTLYELYAAERERLEASGPGEDPVEGAARRARLRELGELLGPLEAELERRGILKWVDEE